MKKEHIARLRKSNHLGMIFKKCLQVKVKKELSAMVKKTKKRTFSNHFNALLQAFRRVKNKIKHNKLKHNERICFKRLDSKTSSYGTMISLIAASRDKLS